MKRIRQSLEKHETSRVLAASIISGFLIGFLGHCGIVTDETFGLFYW